MALGFAYYNYPLLETGKPRIGAGQYGIFAEGLGIVSWRAIKEINLLPIDIRGATSNELRITLSEPLDKALLADWRQRPIHRLLMRLPWGMAADNGLRIPLDVFDQPASEIMRPLYPNDEVLSPLALRQSRSELSRPMEGAVLCSFKRVIGGTWLQCCVKRSSSSIPATTRSAWPRNSRRIAEAIFTGPSQSWCGILRGRLLLQRRHIGKYHSGGLWTNTCCGHPRPGETPIEAAVRRLDEEMRVICNLVPIGTFTYRAELAAGLAEHEFVHLFRGRYEGVIAPDPRECDGYSWSAPDVIRRQIRTVPQAFSAWFRKYVEADWPLAPPPQET